jgi:hypothetical protein
MGKILEVFQAKRNTGGYVHVCDGRNKVSGVPEAL